MSYDSQSPPAKRRPNAAGLAILIGLVVLICLGCLGCVGLVTGGDPAYVGAPATAPSPATTPAPAGKATPAAPSPVPEPKADATAYATLTSRQWRKVAKDPDAYSGKNYVVHGIVTQFDAATGPNTFRADLDGVRHDQAYDYETNTVVSARAQLVGDLVEGDEFTASVQVVGGYTYDTQLGGQTTVPELVAFKIKRR